MLIIVDCMWDMNVNQSAFNPFTPKYLKWTLPSMNFDVSIIPDRDLNKKSKTEQQTL